MSISDIAGSASPAGRLRVERRARRPKIVPDRRRFKRVVVSLNGRFMSEDKREYPCEVLNMSPGGMALRAPISPQIGERIVAYLTDVRDRAHYSKCREEALAGVEALPAHTFLTVSNLAWPGMLMEIDITAAVPR